MDRYLSSLCNIISQNGIITADIQSPHQNIQTPFKVQTDSIKNASQILLSKILKINSQRANSVFTNNAFAKKHTFMTPS